MKFTTNIPHGIIEELKPERLVVAAQANGILNNLYTATYPAVGWVRTIFGTLNQVDVGQFRAEIRIYSPLEVLEDTMWFLTTGIGDMTFKIDFDPPIKIESSAKIRIYTTDANLYIFANAYGYEL